MKRRIYFMGSLFLSVFLFCTKTDPLSGPSTEQGNPVMIGLVMSENQPVAGAQVSVYEYVTIQGSETLGVEVKRITTNEKGNFYLQFIDTGKYAIQCIHPDSSRYAFKKLNIIDSSEVTDTFNLQTPGCLYGTVSRGGVLNSSSNLELLDGDIRVVIIDINRSTITGPDGSYQFFDLPAGNYNIAYYPGGSFFSSYRSNVSVISDLITSIDTVFLKSIPLGGAIKTGESYRCVRYVTCLSDTAMEGCQGVKHSGLCY